MDSDQQEKPPSSVTSPLSVANLIVACVLGIGFFIFDFFYGDQMFRISTDWSEQIFDSSPFLNGWFWFCSVPLYYTINFSIYVIVYYLRDKHRALKYLCWILIHHLISETIKLIYRDSRPCFQSDLIGSNNCSCSFGKFSGHASGSTLFYLLLYSEVIHPIKMSKWLKISWLFILVFIIFNIGFSRIYIGVHSFNQVILGCFYGYVLFSVNLAFKDFFDLRFAALLNIETAKYQVKILWFKVSIFILALLCNGLLVLFWALAVNNYEGVTDQAISSSVCVIKCRKTSKYLANNHLDSGSFSWIVVGIFGVFLIRPNNSTTVPNIHYYKSTWKNFKLVLFRFLAFLLVSLPVIAAFITATFYYGIWNYLIMIGLLVLYAGALIHGLPRLLRVSQLAISGDMYFDASQEMGPVSPTELVNISGKKLELSTERQLDNLERFVNPRHN
jgi:membrane-associated phospholipid phosphatase